MSTHGTIPLGIDVGRSRVRIAQITQEAQGPTLRCSIALDLAPDNDLATTVREALEQSGISERRCVVSLGEPDAMLVPLALPSMSLLERRRTARFEASRVIDYPIDEARIHLKMLNRTRGLHVLESYASVRFHRESAGFGPPDFVRSQSIMNP